MIDCPPVLIATETALSANRPGVSTNPPFNHRTALAARGEFRRLLWGLHALITVQIPFPPRLACFARLHHPPRPDVKSYGRSDRIPHLRPLASAVESRDRRPSAGKSIRSNQCHYWLDCRKT